MSGFLILTLTNGDITIVNVDRIYHLSFKGGKTRVYYEKCPTADGFQEVEEKMDEVVAKLEHVTKVS